MDRGSNLDVISLLRSQSVEQATMKHQAEAFAPARHRSYWGFHCARYGEEIAHQGGLPDDVLVLHKPVPFDRIETLIRERLVA